MTAIMGMVSARIMTSRTSAAAAESGTTATMSDTATESGTTAAAAATSAAATTRPGTTATAIAAEILNAAVLHIHECRQQQNKRSKDPPVHRFTVGPVFFAA
jgi:hypothetical protein